MDADSYAGPGGAAKTDERPEVAMIRETREEYEMDVEIIGPLLIVTKDTMASKKVFNCHFYILCPVDATKPPSVRSYLSNSVCIYAATCKQRSRTSPALGVENIRLTILSWPRSRTPKRRRFLALR